MSAVLDIVKRYLFEILCGVGAALGIALSLVGMGAMSDITTEMREVQTMKEQLHTLANKPNPTNMKSVAQARARINEIHSTYAEVLDFVRQRNEFPPLLPGVFPDTTQPKARTDFQRAYIREVGGWINILKAGHVPSEDAIAQERDLMEAEITALQLGGGRATRPEGETDKNIAASRDHDARVRASVRNAKEIYCYATPDAFHVSAVSSRGGPMYKEEPASLEDLWRAQLEVWVQRSVVDAILSINDAAAEAIRAREDDNHPWVGNLPIKELISLQTTTHYVVEGTTASTGSSRVAGAADRAYPPGNSADVFTVNHSNPLFETMQFSVQLIVDARDIPLVISDLCAGRFHTPLRVSYEAVPPNLSMEGKIYGDEPVVKLVVDFETVFFSELYLPLMPDKILESLGKTRPEAKTGEGA